MAAPQSYKNHTRFDPVYHYFLMPVMLLSIPASVLWYVHHHRPHMHSGLWVILVSVALFVLTAITRVYALKLQNRIIRLEEKHRIAALVSAAELIEVDSLSMEQYIALRFASNAELPDLARRAIRENLTGKQIKQNIVSWRPDYDRV